MLAGLLERGLGLLRLAHLFQEAAVVDIVYEQNRVSPAQGFCDILRLPLLDWSAYDGFGLQQFGLTGMLAQ